MSPNNCWVTGASAVTSVKDGRLPELENEIQAKPGKAEGLPAMLDREAMAAKNVRLKGVLVRALSTGQLSFD